LWPARRTRSSPVASHPSIAPGLLTSRRRRFRVGARSSRRDGVYLQPAHHSDRTRSAMGSELWSAPPPGKGRRSRPFLWKGGPASQKDVSRPSVGSHPSERRPAYEARLWQEQKQQMLDPTQGGLHRPLPAFATRPIQSCCQIGCTTHVQCDFRNKIIFAPYFDISAFRAAAHTCMRSVDLGTL
jgi:hypothetical protein